MPQLRTQFYGLWQIQINITTLFMGVIIGLAHPVVAGVPPWLWSFPIWFRQATGRLEPPAGAAVSMGNAQLFAAPRAFYETNESGYFDRDFVVIELGFNGSWLGFNGDFVEFIEFNGGFCGISWDFNGMQFQIQIYLCLNRKNAIILVVLPRGILVYGRLCCWTTRTFAVKWLLWGALAKRWWCYRKEYGFCQEKIVLWFFPATNQNNVGV